jgi:hypothetical protein
MDLELKKERSHSSAVKIIPVFYACTFKKARNARNIEGFNLQLIPGALLQLKVHYCNDQN